VNDMKDLFELALSDMPRTGEHSHPADDLTRGRRMLRRRRQRMAGLAGVTAAVLCGILVPLSLNGSAPAASHPVAAASSHSPSSQPRSSQPRPSRTGTAEPQTAQIKLVAWQGTQPPGYRVDWMPKGWVVQGSTPYALTMAPPDAKDKNPDVFIGKLVVMLQSRDAAAPPASWADQPVNGRPGKFDAQGDTQILTFQVAGGQWVVIQAPVSLGWDSAELAKFGGGVQVLAAAQQGRG
jgi:hypothetical protein